MIVSKRFIKLFALGLVPLIFVKFIPSVVLMIFIYDLFLVVILLFDYLAMKKGLSLKIERIKPKKLSIGIENKIKIFVQNFSKFTLKIWITDDFPAEFLPKNEIMFNKISPYNQKEMEYGVIPVSRGKYEFENINYRVETLLGFATVHKKIEQRSEAKVYPNLVGLKNIAIANRFKDLKVLGFHSLQRDGVGTDFEKLREYLPDDDFKDINWKATAKHQKPITQIYETERSQNVITCIDCGRTMAAKVGNLSKLDYAINSALILAYTALKNDDKVGLIVFTNEVKKFLPPKKGNAQFQRLMKTLYEIKADLSFVDYKELFKYMRIRNLRRSLVVIYTDVLDEETSSPLIKYIKLLVPKHLPLCITINDQNILKLSEMKVKNVEDVYKKVVANELISEREVLLNDLTKGGVQLIDNPPQEIVVSAVNKYLELKKRLSI